MTVWSVTPGGIGGDYSSLSAALSNASTVAGDIIEISGDWTGAYDTTKAVVSDDNITIRTKPGDQSRHNGQETSGPNYRLATTGAGHCLTINNDGCKIEYIIIALIDAATSDEGIRVSAPTNSTLTIIGTIWRTQNNKSDQDGIHIPNDNTLTINVENCAAIGWGRAGIFIQNNGGAATQTVNAISYCAWNCGRWAGEAFGGGIAAIAGNASSVSNVNMHNCWCVGNTAADSDDYCGPVFGSGTVNWNLDNCMSGDASVTARDSGAVNPTENASITDVAPGVGVEVAVNDISTLPYDLRLQDDANNDAQDQHGNASGAGLTFGDYAGAAVDVAETVRPQNTNYDLGFFEVVGGPPPTGRIMSSLVAAGGLVGSGGIAGSGGGLAG